MTEDEAKTKWCPQYQVNGGTDADDNRSTRFNPETKTYGPSLENPKCIGSACMAFRWIPLMADDAFKDAVIKAAADIGDKTDSKHRAAKHVTENRAAYGLPVAPFDGFCGLAGKP